MNFIDQRRIVVARAGLVDVPGNRPHAQLVIASQQFGPARAVRPRLEIGLVEDHRHSIMNRPRQRVRLRDNDRARHYGLPGLGILPPISEAREAQGAAICSTDVIRRLAIGADNPFVIAARRNDASVALENVAEHRLVDDALGAGIEASRQLLQWLFHHHGMRPQRTDTSSVAPFSAVLTTSTLSVGGDVVVHPANCERRR